MTLENRSTSMSSVGRTLPASTPGRGRCARGRRASRARPAPSGRPAARARAGGRAPRSAPRGRVPAIGRVETRRALHAHQRLGRRPRQLHPPSIRRKNMYGAGFVDAQPPVDRIARRRRGNRQPPRRHALEDVAGQDVLLERGDRSRGTARRPCWASRRDRRVRPSGQARRGRGDRAADPVRQLLRARPPPSA